MLGDTEFLFKTPSNIAYPNVAAMYPQLVLRPFSNYTIFSPTTSISMTRPALQGS